MLKFLLWMVILDIAAWAVEYLFFYRTGRKSDG